MTVVLPPPPVAQGVEVHGYGSMLQADTTQFNKSRNAGIAAHDGGAVQLETCALLGSVTSSVSSMPEGAG